MSHLSSHRKKKNTAKIFLLLVVSVGLLIFLFQVGLNSIINSTVFLNDVTGKNKDVEEKKEDEFYGTLNVDEPEQATNSAKLIMSGDASDFETVEYYINNEKVDSGKIKSDGTFTEEIGSLKSGENKLYIIAKTKDNTHEKKSDLYVVNYINQKPKLEIETPKDGDTVSKDEVTIKGSTDKNVTVRINNTHVVVDLNGGFTTTFHLKEGENKLEITATDIAGNIEKKEMTVKYDKED